MPEGHKRETYNCTVSEHENVNFAPIFWGPGFGISAFRGLTRINQELSSLGHDVFTLEHPLPGGKDMLEEELEDAKADALVNLNGNINEKEYKRLLNQIPVEIYRKAKAFIDVAERNFDGPIDAVGHSFGGLYVPVAALLRPDLFKNIVLINPAGWTGKVESRNMRVGEKIRESRIERLEKESGWKNHIRALALTAKHVGSIIGSFEMNPKYFDRNRILRDSFSYVLFRIKDLEFYKEAFAMANTDALPTLEFLKDLGINISLVIDTKDWTFNHKKTLKRKPKWMNYVMTDKLSHFGPVKNPKDVALIIHELLQKEHGREFRQAAE